MSNPSLVLEHSGTITFLSGFAILPKIQHFEIKKFKEKGIEKPTQAKKGAACKAVNISHI